MTSTSSRKNRRTGDSQILLLQRRLDNHIEEFNSHCKREDERWDRFMVTQEINTASIKALVTSNKELSDSTRDIVSVWQAASGTMKTMSAVGRFTKWLSGLAILGVIAKWTFDHFR